MDEPVDIGEPVDHVPIGIHSLYWAMWRYRAVSILVGILWIWMFIDCFRRYGGLNYWHYLFFFMPPVAPLMYFALHYNQITRSRGGGLFGPSLKSRIKKAQQRLRLADTLAARAELGELFFENKQYAECEEEFRKILAAEPNNLEALYHIGMSKLRRGDAPGALEFLRQVVERDRKLRFGRAWLSYTETLIAVGRKEEALEERKKLSRAFPRPLTEFAYAELLADCAQRDKAREVLEDMIATCDNAPSEDRVFIKRGKSLLSKVSARV